MNEKDDYYWQSRQNMMNYYLPELTRIYLAGYVGRNMFPDTLIRRLHKWNLIKIKYVTTGRPGRHFRRIILVGDVVQLVESKLSRRQLKIAN